MKPRAKWQVLPSVGTNVFFLLYMLMFILTYHPKM